MTRPIPPMFFIGVFLLIAIAAILMLASVMTREPTEADGGATAAPREALARQLVLLKHGDTAALRTTFLAPLRDSVTAASVTAALPAFAERSVHDLVASIEVSETDGETVAVVKTPDGEVLTRFVQTDGVWLADRVWFVSP